MATLEQLQQFKLQPLVDKLAIVEPEGRPTQQFQEIWEDQGNTIEGAIQLLAQALQGVLDAQAAAEAAQGAADDAQAAADAAQAAAEGASGGGSLSSSGVVGLTLSAADAGSDASITVSGHDRVYGDGTTVAVTGDTITGLAFLTAYWVYYDDPTRAGGAVTYVASTDPADALQAGDRHSVGAITTPADGGVSTDGNPNLPSGIVMP